MVDIGGASADYLGNLQYALTARNFNPVMAMAPAADDDRLAVLFHHCDQGDVIDKVDIHEERGFLLGELALHGEETAVEGVRTHTANCPDKIVSVLRPEGADFHLAPVSHALSS